MKSIFSQTITNALRQKHLQVLTIVLLLLFAFVVNIIFNVVNVGTKIGIMKQGALVHTVDTADVTANELQQLYLETI